MVTLSSDNYQRLVFSQWDRPHHTQIHLNNLSFNAFVGADPWGRPGPRANILQPVLLSCRIALRKPFSTASASDTVDSSTVNYSTLSKEILRLVEGRGPQNGHAVEDMSLNDMVNWLVSCLTGCSAKIGDVSETEWSSRSETETFQSPEDGKLLLLRPQDLTELEFKIALDKGTLMSQTVTFTKRLLFNKGIIANNPVLTLEGMRVPTLIGVNANERTARQMVIATVEVDAYNNGVSGPYIQDCYPALEEIVFKTIEESSFETLESLAIHVADRVIKLFLDAHLPAISHHDNRRVRVKLEKPTAVTFASSPAIEIIQNDGFSAEPRPMEKVPFPLQGRLDKWLEEHRS